MSKLDGNERWNSKMLLTEHQEKYDSRNEPKKNTGPTPEELTMIRDYVLLPHMLTMVQRSLDDIARSRDSLKRRLYMTAAQALMDRISNDMYGLRRKLSQANIKIYGDEQVDAVIYYNYKCRGYQDRIGMVREVMKAEIGVRLTKYIGELEKLLRENNTGGYKKEN